MLLKYSIRFLFFGALFILKSNAQTFTLSGKVVRPDSSLADNATVILKSTGYFTTTNTQGVFKIQQVVPATYILVITTTDNLIFIDTLLINKNMYLHVKVDTLSYDYSTVVIESTKNNLGNDRLQDVEGANIYAGKKNEVIKIDEITGNTATNNPRQVYGKIVGLNIFESDGGGLQLGIGGRGLNPNRVSNFNTRQNGYDISADALGYPESYYTPPIDALERIEIVRGAASLQYGTQFGGFINFKFKTPPIDKKIHILSKQTVGSFGLMNSFNSLSGTTGKLSYYTYIQYKRSDGWRPNAHFDLASAHASLKYQWNKHLSTTIEYTFQYYLAQQPGGLTDRQFLTNPQQSNRERNWFKVNWNLIAFLMDYKFNSNTLLNIRVFGLIAGRDALGFLGNIDRADPLLNRDYLSDKYRNYGVETRLLHHYKIKNKNATFLIGNRYYHGTSLRKQGEGNDGYGPDFYYINPDSLEGSDYRFPSYNIALFSENIFYLTDRWSVTPGVRWEYISTASEGYYTNIQKDLAGNIILYERINDNRINRRSFVLFGIGTSYKLSDNINVYANISQNYRSINFNDMRVNNPNLQINPNLKDERGFSSDIGIRGKHKNWLDFDANVFYMFYKDRIGTILERNAQNVVYRYRTNVSDSRNFGVEMFVEIDFLKCIHPEAKSRFSWFNNIAVIDARYISSEQTAFQGKKVEYVPVLNYRTGLTYKHKQWRTVLQMNYLSQQFSDATNTTAVVPNAVVGIIPSYTVWDWSIEYTYKYFTAITGVNNLLNASYFTRRAEGYPGPGILPSDARSVFFTLQFKW